MIPHILMALVAIVVVAVAWAFVAWFIQREPAGNGQHGARGDHRSFRRVEPRHAQTLPCLAATVPVTATEGRPPWEADTMTDVIPTRVVAALTNARPDETVIDVNHASLPRYIEHLAGGDPFDGLGSADAYLARLFTPAGAR